MLTPLTKEYPWNSTYAFSENDPINFIDLDGLEKAKPQQLTVRKPILTVSNSVYHHTKEPVHSIALNIGLGKYSKTSIEKKGLSETELLIAGLMEKDLSVKDYNVTDALVKKEIFVDNEYFEGYLTLKT